MGDIKRRGLRRRATVAEALGEAADEEEGVLIGGLLGCIESPAEVGDQGFVGATLNNFVIFL